MKQVLSILLLAQTSFLSYGQKGFEPTAAVGERRFALVIGNKDYRHIRALRNTLNDAVDMKTALKNLGFEVTMVQNTDYRNLAGAINRFVVNLQIGDVALVYYSGHGLSYNGKNYLLPIDAQVTCLEQLDEHGYSLNKIIGDIAVRGVKNSFYLLDACRSVPNLKLCTATSKDATMAPGLVKPSNNPRGSMIVYATEEGSTADDNVSERNGMFTGALLKYLTQPNLGIRGILDLTTSEVLTKTSDRQSPARYDKLLGDFVFIQSQTPTPQPEVVSPKPMPVKKVDLLPYEPEMVFVKGGTFQMGSYDGENDEKPIHNVTISDFYMGKYEVTVANFKRFVEETNYETDAEKGDGSYIYTGKWEKKAGINWRFDAAGNLRNSEENTHPVIHVSWNDAQAYCDWLSKKTGKNYHLPSEAAWEYAAGNGNKHSKYSWGDGLPSGIKGGNVGDEKGKSVFNDWTIFDGYNDGYVYTAPVGNYAPNELGLYDMTGNVWEWCLDWYSKSDYSTSSTRNPVNNSTATDRVLRGGSWDDYPQNSLVANRDINVPGSRAGNTGFRVVFPSESK